MGGVGDHHVGCGYISEHAPIGNFPLALTEAALDLRVTIGLLHLVFDFLLGHAQLAVVIPKLERHIHRGNQDQTGRQQDQGEHDHAPRLGDSLPHGQRDQAHNLALKGQQHQGGDPGHQEKFHQCLEQFNQRLAGEDAAKALDRIEFVQARAYRLQGKYQAAHRGRSQQRHDHGEGEKRYDHFQAREQRVAQKRTHFHGRAHGAGGRCQGRGE